MYWYKEWWITYKLQKRKNVDVNVGRAVSTNKWQEEIPIEIVEKQKYEKSVSESKKLRNSIKRVVDRNITVISKSEYNDVLIKYGELLMILRFQTMMVKYMMFTMYMTIIKFLIKTQ